MADPFTWAAIGLSVVGGVVSAAGAMQAGDARSNQYAYEAQIQEQNKTLADQDRQQAIATANLAAQDKNLENTRRLAAIRASYGTSGLELAGSPLDVLNDTSVGMALDVKRTSYEGQVKGREGALKMLGFQDQANMDSISSKNARSAGYSDAGSALLGGATRATSIAADQWGTA